MLNLDIRDYRFWINEARRKIYEGKIHDIRMSRMAWVKGEDVQSEIAGYLSAIERLDALDGISAAAPAATSWLIVTGGKRVGRA